MDKPSNLFKKLLNKRMEERGLSQMDVERLSGVPQATVGRYKRGATEPGLDNAIKIAGVFGLSLEEFLENSVPTPAAPSLPEGIREAIREELSGGSIPPAIRALLPRLAKLNEEDAAVIAHQLRIALDALAEPESVEASQRERKRSNR